MIIQTSEKLPREFKRLDFPYLTSKLPFKGKFIFGTFEGSKKIYTMAFVNEFIDYIYILGIETNLHERHKGYAKELLKWIMNKYECVRLFPITMKAKFWYMNLGFMEDNNFLIYKKNQDEDDDYYAQRFYYGF